MTYVPVDIMTHLNTEIAIRQNKERPKLFSQGWKLYSSDKKAYFTVKSIVTLMRMEMCGND